MSFWFKFFQDEHSRALIRRARARVIWPWVLCRVSDHDGEVPDSELDPWRISDDHDAVISEDDAAGMISRLKSVGALVWTGEGWTSHDWPARRADPTAKARKAAQREREKSALSTQRGHGCHSDMRDTRDVTHVTPEEIREEEKRKEKTGGVVDTPREDKAPAEPPPTPTHRPATPTNEPDLRAACDAYQRAMPPGRNGGVGVFMPPALVESIRSIAADFGARMVIDAVNASVEAKGHVPGPTYVRRICERLRADERRPVALPFKVVPTQVEEPMSEDERQAALARMMSLEI